MTETRKPLTVKPNPACRTSGGTQCRIVLRALGGTVEELIQLALVDDSVDGALYMTCLTCESAQT